MNWLLSFLFAALCGSVSCAITADERKWMVGGKCRMKWRPERLSGECPGLKLHSTFDEIKHIQVVNNSVVCKSLCCNLEEKCTTWQFELSERRCMLGGPVLTYNETAPAGMTVLGKCSQPLPSWTGRKIEARKNNTCTWGARLPNQCTGMGAERKHKNGTRLSARQCEMACCESKQCDMWQESPKHGCYFNVKEKVTCDEAFKRKVYDGGRKCIQGLCGGLEHMILNRTVSTAAVQRGRYNATSMMLSNQPSTDLRSTAVNAFKAVFGNMGAINRRPLPKNRPDAPADAAAATTLAAPDAVVSSDSSKTKPLPFGGLKGKDAVTEMQKKMSEARAQHVRMRNPKMAPKMTPKGAPEAVNRDKAGLV